MKIPWRKLSLLRWTSLVTPGTKIDTARSSGSIYVFVRIYHNLVYNVFTNIIKTYETNYGTAVCKPAIWGWRILLGKIWLNGSGKTSDWPPPLLEYHGMHRQERNSRLHGRWPQVLFAVIRRTVQHGLIKSPLHSRWWFLVFAYVLLQLAGSFRIVVLKKLAVLTTK